MRSKDKKKHMKKVNLLFEERYNQESIEEISPEMKQRAISQMKDRGQDNRADKWTQHFGTKDLEKFKDKPFTTRNGSKLLIYGFSVQGNELHVNYGSPRSQEFNRSQGTFVYDSESDSYGNIGTINRQLARILSLIAMTTNPETKYKNGTGDFQIIGY